MELLFERAADSLQAAISSAITDVERAGYRVSKIKLEREANPGYRLPDNRVLTRVQLELTERNVGHC